MRTDSGQRQTIEAINNRIRDLRRAQENTTDLGSQEERDYASQIESLESLIDEVNKDRVVGVPFVIVAMNQEEASNLLDENAFNNNDDSPRFQKFKHMFEIVGGKNCQTNYSSSREGWKPLICSEKTIEGILCEIIFEINEFNLESLNVPLFYPIFYSTDFFLDDHKKRERIRRKIERLGGVIILDAISLFHSGIRQKLFSSHLTSNRRIAFITISPTETITNDTDEFIKDEIREKMERAFARFDLYFDPLCEIGVGNLHALKRWLFANISRVPTILQTVPHYENPEFGENVDINKAFKGF